MDTKHTGDIDSLNRALIGPKDKVTFGDMMYAPPVVTNHWAQAQCSRGPTGVVAFNALPWVAGYEPTHPWYHTNINTGVGYLNGKLIEAEMNTHEMTVNWALDHSFRRCEDDQLAVTNRTFCPWDEPALVQEIVITNKTDQVKQISFGICLRGYPGRIKSGQLGKSFGVWDAKKIDGPLKGSLGFVTDGACVVEGLLNADGIRQDRISEAFMVLAPHAEARFCYVAALGETFKSASTVYMRLDEIEKTGNLYEIQSDQLESRLQHVFRNIPYLDTSNEVYRQFYLTGLRALWMTRVESPEAMFHPTWRSIGPQLCINGIFVWDWAVAPKTFVMAEPEMVLHHLRYWINEASLRSSATCLIYGVGIGNWYPANHWSILRVAHAYTQRYGIDWLKENAGLAKNLKALENQALYWSCDINEQGIACHKDSDLLEVVGDYRGAVAGINANHAHGMLLMAELYLQAGYATEAQRMHGKAMELINAIVEHMWDETHSSFVCIYEDGTRRHLFHAYDALMCLELIEDYLPDQMISAIITRLKTMRTPAWMHACDPGDPEACWSPRADHGALGSYPAWCGLFAAVLKRHGMDDEDEAWLQGLARTCANGTLGQAHLADDIFPPIRGGAQKACSEHPYRNEWYSQGSTSFLEMILDEL